MTGIHCQPTSLKSIIMTNFYLTYSHIDPFLCEKLRENYCVMAAILVGIIVQGHMDK